MVHLVAIVFPDNFSFLEQEKEMELDRPSVDGSIEGNIRDSTTRVAADVLKDGTAFFIFQQFLNPAKDQRAEFDRPKAGNNDADNLTRLYPEWELEERYVGIRTGRVIGSGWR
jgi:hypothetical protein